MVLKSATVPWSRAIGQGRGRPRKDASRPGEPAGCIWPQADGTCRARREPGLALCADHAEILSQSSRWCVWPGCTQSSYRASCTYHTKIVHLLIEAPRGSGAL